MSRRIFTPGRVDRDDQHRRALVLVRLGVGDRHHDQEVRHRRVRGEPLAAVDDPVVAVEHRGRLEQRRVRARGVRLGHRERRLEVAGQQRVQPLLLLVLRAGQREDLRVARVGRRVAEHDRRERRRAEDLVHQAELDLAEALAAELGVEVRRPQAALAHLLLQRRDRAPEARRRRARRRSSRSARSPRARTRASSPAAAWNSGSVEKSQAMRSPRRSRRSRLESTVAVVTPLLVAAGVAVHGRRRAAVGDRLRLRAAGGAAGVRGARRRRRRSACCCCSAWRSAC